MSVYYNENDPKAAAWLRELIFEGQIAWGDVDERSIEDVKPSELVGYAQCHFFAGIGGWSYALRLAGWPDDKPVWTGSCPCQPFSAAGKGKGFADERHLWPSWFHLIQQCSPTWIFGEQVASPAGLQWFDLVHNDLEGASYSAEAFDLCAAGVGAPHIRQRLYWMAYRSESRSHANVSVEQPQAVYDSRQKQLERCGATIGGAVGELGDASSTRSGRDTGAVPRAQESAERGVRSQLDIAQPASAAGGMADDWLEGRGQVSERPMHGSPWGNAVWVPCRDGKSRPVEPGSFPLAHGVPGRVGLLRGYGNAIVAPLAAAFIEATGLA